MGVFDAANDRAERDRFRGRRTALADLRNHGGMPASVARDLSREARTARDREYWKGYAVTMTEKGNR